MQALRVCRVTKEFRFESAHQIPNHKGKCARLHGHSYKLEVSVRGLIHAGDRDLSTGGMVIDFSDLKEIVSTLVIDRIDHYNLNEVLPPEYHPTTAENISYWIFHQLAAPIIQVAQSLQMTDARAKELFGPLAQATPPFCLEAIRLWETSTSFTTVTLKDILDAEEAVQHFQRQQDRFLGTKKRAK